MTWMKSPGEKYGGSIAATPGPAAPEAEATATVAPSITPSMAGFLSPSEPAFWFGVITAAGVGMMAYSTYVPVVG